MDDNTWVSVTICIIKFVAFLYDIVTYPLYLVIQKPWKTKALSKRIKAKPVSYGDDRTSVTYRSVDDPGPLHVRLLRDRVDTMEKVMRFAVENYGSRPFLGTRKILAEEDETQSNGHVVRKCVMGEYNWKTVSEVDRLASCFGRGLRTLGLKPQQNIAIFADTRAEWLIAAHGCFKQSLTVTTIYTSLGDDAVAYGIKESEATVVITTHDLLPKFHVVLEKVPRVNIIIYMEDQLKETDTEGLDKRIKIVPFSKVVEEGTAASHISNVPPAPDDTAIIMYTSGSTGIPKGVLLRHWNILGTIKAFSDVADLGDGDIFLGFLPLAHIYELIMESLCLLLGLQVGYSSHLTMNDSSVKIKRGAKGDASVLHPTCISCVPLILNRIRKGVNDKIANGGAFRQALFDFAYAYKCQWSERGFDTPLLNRFIFRATRQLMGNHLRQIFSGGAPLSPDTHKFIRTCMCVQIIQGYGLTETCGCATVMDRHDRTTGHVGGPTTVCDIRLVNWEEGNYRVTDKPYPRGEIIIGGETVSPGYYNNPEKTKEDFFEEDGQQWFRTGDIGECHEDGVLKIIDRKKDIVKLQLGEYVSLGKVEAELKTCPLVENICIYGNSFKNYTVALVVPSQPHLVQLGNCLGLGNLSFEQLCGKTEMERAVQCELETHGKKCKLEKFEIPVFVKLCMEIWSPDTGLVTAALKLKRKEIQKKYQRDINKMYLL